jgi:hypothetical protein
MHVCDYSDEVKRWFELLLSLILFRLVAPPLQPGVVGHIRYRVYDSLVVCHRREPVISRILGRN